MDIISLKKRKDFIEIATNGNKSAARGLVLQTKKRAEKNNYFIKVGYTTTKKLGKAVVRNRVKRKLRAVSYSVMKEFAKESHDYVIIGRKATLERKYDDLVKDLKFALHSTNTHK